MNKIPKFCTGCGKELIPTDDIVSNKYTGHKVNGMECPSYRMQENFRRTLYKKQQDAENRYMRAINAYSTIRSIFVSFHDTEEGKELFRCRVQTYKDYIKFTNPHDAYSANDINDLIVSK